MKKYFGILKNWRIMALTALAVAALAMIACDTDDIGTLLISKIAGIALAYVSVMLCIEWEDRIGELDIFKCDE